jgi:hypothetical protein
VVGSSACRALAYVSAQHPTNQACAIGVGACSSVCASLRKHLSLEAVTKNAVHAVAELSAHKSSSLPFREVVSYVTAYCRLPVF